MNGREMIYPSSMSFISVSGFFIVEKTGRALAVRSG